MCDTCLQTPCAFGCPNHEPEQMIEMRGYFKGIRVALAALEHQIDKGSGQK